MLSKLLSGVIRFAYVYNCLIERIYAWCERALSAITAAL